MLFDIDTFVKQSGGSYRIDHYFEKIKAASTNELKKFKAAVKKHRRSPQSHRFATTIEVRGKYTFSPHNEMLLPAINWELAQRSPIRLRIYNLLFSIKKRWVGFWLGANLKKHPQLGQILVYRKHGDTALEFYGLRVLLLNGCLKVLHYIKRHHWKIITAVISLLGILYVGK